MNGFFNRAPKISEIRRPLDYNTTLSLKYVHFVVPTGYSSTNICTNYAGMCLILGLYKLKR